MSTALPAKINADKCISTEQSLSAKTEACEISKHKWKAGLLLRDGARWRVGLLEAEISEGSEGLYIRGEVMLRCFSHSGGKKGRGSSGSVKRGLGVIGVKSQRAGFSVIKDRQVT